MSARDVKMTDKSAVKGKFTEIPLSERLRDKCVLISSPDSDDYSIRKAWIFKI
jgi:hypothetical protein